MLNRSTAVLRDRAVLAKHEDGPAAMAAPSQRRIEQMSPGFRTVAISFAMLTIVAGSAARAESEQQALVQRARITVEDLKRDKEFGTARDLLPKARAILIVPRLFKGGFFVGGEGGRGILLARQAGGGWSSPAFYGIGSASFGLQIGLQESEMVLFVMTQKGLDAILQDQFKVGVGAGIAVVTLGSGVEAATTSAVGADIVTWASSSGAYAGVTLNGSVIKPAHEDDAKYYGRPVTTRQIVGQKYMPQTDTVALHRALTTN